MSNGAKILVIDDEKSIRHFIEVTLQNEGLGVDLCKTGTEGIAQFADQHPDLIILDLGLPDMPGLEVLKKLRAMTDTPVIILTVNNTDDEKVALLDAGADDYLTKPFSTNELLARIRVALRHSINVKDSSNYVNGPLRVNFNTREVMVNSILIKLTPNEFNLLKVLVKFAGRIITQSQLLKEVWGTHAVDQAHYVTVYVSQLRRKLEKDTGVDNLITTEHGVGYRLNTF